MKVSFRYTQKFIGRDANRIVRLPIFGDREKMTYVPKTGAMADEAGATAFPNRGVMVVNAEALAVRRAAAR